MRRCHPGTERRSPTDPRHLGTIGPLWTLLDLTPEGRQPDWDEQLDDE
jgi:predicted dithiol-disulfide oxidoreductase (DUF899 family)